MVLAVHVVAEEMMNSVDEGLDEVDFSKLPFLPFSKVLLPIRYTFTF